MFVFHLVDKLLDQLKVLWPDTLGAVNQQHQVNVARPAGCQRRNQSVKVLTHLLGTSDCVSLFNPEGVKFLQTPNNLLERESMSPDRRLPVLCKAGQKRSLIEKALSRVFASLFGQLPLVESHIKKFWHSKIKWFISTDWSTALVLVKHKPIPQCRKDHCGNCVFVLQ